MTMRMTVVVLTIIYGVPSMRCRLFIHYDAIQCTKHSNCSLQSLSCVQLFATLWTAACQRPLSSTIFWSLLKFISVELVILSNHLILCHPLLLLPSVFPSIRVFSKKPVLHIFPSIRVFSNESVLHIKWPKDQSFSFSNSPSNEYSGLISFRMDWFDVLAIQGTQTIMELI